MQTRWRANATYEDSSSDDEGPAGCSLYSVLPQVSRPHYKAALRAFRRAHNRRSYISHLRRRGVAVLDPHPSVTCGASALSVKPVSSAAGEAEHGGPAVAAEECAVAGAAQRPASSATGQAEGEEDAVDDADGLDGVVRLPFAMASEGAAAALGWLARAVEAGAYSNCAQRCPHEAPGLKLITPVA